MKMIIAGPRSFTDKSFVEMWIRRIIYQVVPLMACWDGDLKIISGMAQGVDTIGYLYAKENGYDPIERPYPPGSGKRGGPMRNVVMAKECDFALVFWDGQSKGTRDLINRLLAFGKPFHLVMVDANLVRINSSAAQSSFDL